MNKINNITIINDIISTFINIIKNIRNFGYEHNMFDNILDKLKFISFKSEKFDIYKNLIIDIINSLPSKKEKYEFNYKLWDYTYIELTKRQKIKRNNYPFNQNKILRKIGHIWNGIISLNQELETK